jgi:hypothetical protein
MVPIFQKRNLVSGIWDFVEVQGICVTTGTIFSIVLWSDWVLCVIYWYICPLTLPWVQTCTVFDDMSSLRPSCFNGQWIFMSLSDDHPAVNSTKARISELSLFLLFHQKWVFEGCSWNKLACQTISLLLYISVHLEIGTSSVDWTQLNRFYLKTETESSLRNVVFWKINRTVFR